MSQQRLKSPNTLYYYSVVVIILLILLLPFQVSSAKNDINYDEQIVVIVQPDKTLKNALKGFDLKKIKKLKIKDAQNSRISLNFWDSYKVLKK